MTSFGKRNIVFLLFLLVVVGFYPFYVLFILVDLILVGYWLFCIITMISHTNTLEKLGKGF